MSSKDHHVEESSGLLNSLLQKVSDDNNKTDINHHVEPKQVIVPESPAKEQQRDFIDEGGNSQPLKK